MNSRLMTNEVEEEEWYGPRPKVAHVLRFLYSMNELTVGDSLHTH